MNVAVPRLLGFKQAASAGEDDLGFPQEINFILHEFGAGAAEGREFVHVVVDGDIAREITRKCERGGCVVPKHPALPRQRGEVIFNQLLL